MVLIARSRLDVLIKIIVAFLMTNAYFPRISFLAQLKLHQRSRLPSLHFQFISIISGTGRQVDEQIKTISSIRT